MKLHLPKMLTAALLAAFTTVGFTLPQAQASTEYNGVTYSGYIYNIATNKSTTFHDRDFTNYYSTDGGETWLTSTAFNGAGKSYYNGTEQKSTTEDKPFWRFTFGDGTGVKSTLRLTGATANVYLEAQFSPFYLGGLIAEAGDYTYAVGRQPGNKDCALTLLAEAGQKANMSIASNVHLSARNGFTVASSGTWDVASGKTLAVGRYDSGSNVDSVQNNNSIIFNDGLHVDMIGGGTVDLTHTNALTVGQGTTISVGEDTTLLFASATTLGGTITNNGKVTFTSDTVNLASDLSGFTHSGAYTDYNGADAQDGFAGKMEYTIIEGEGNTNLAKVNYGGKTAVALTDGKLIVDEGTDYTTYQINTASATLDLDKAATLADGALTTVTVHGAGATIAVGSAQTLTTLSIASGADATISGEGSLAVTTLNNSGSLAVGSAVTMGALALKSSETPAIQVQSGGVLTITTASTVDGQKFVNGESGEQGNTQAFSKLFKGLAVGVQDGGKLVLQGNMNFNDSSVTGAVTMNSGVAAMEITGNVQINTYGDGCTWALGNHSLEVGGDLWLTNKQFMEVQNGNFAAGTLKLGHDANAAGGGYRSSLTATSGSTVALGGIAMYGGHNEVNIDGSTLTFTKAEGNVLSQVKNAPSAAADLNKVVFNNATLNAINNGWSLQAISGTTIALTGTNTVNVAAEKAVTLSANSIAGTLTKEGEGALTLVGTTAGTVIGKAIDLNAGSLTMTGDFNIDALEVSGEQTTWERAEGIAEGSGFKKVSGTVTVVEKDDSTTLNAAGATAIRENVRMALADTGIVTLGGTANYTTLWVNNTGDVSYDVAQTLADEVNVGTVHLNSEGATVTMDKAGAAVDIVVTDGVNAGVKATQNTTINSITGLGAEKTITISGEGTVSFSQDPVITASNVAVNGGHLELGGARHLITLSVTNGTVTTTHSGSNPCISGSLTINEGGVFTVAGEHQDAFGYTGGTTSNMDIYLAGKDGNHAVLALNQQTDSTVTMSANLHFGGYADVTSTSTGFNTYGGQISVTGVDNTITNMQLRKAVTVTVEEDGVLTINNMTRFGGFSDGLTKEGAGKLVFDGTNVLDKTIQVNGGSLVLNGTYSIGGIADVVSYEFDGGAEGNGFMTTTRTKALYALANDATGTIGDGAVIKIGETDVTESVTDGAYSTSTRDDSVFYVNTGTEAVSSARASQNLVGIMMLGDNTTLTVDDDLAATEVEAYGNNVTLSIGEGKKVTGQVSGFILDGTGTYAISGLNNVDATLGTGVSLANSWAGTVKFSGCTTLKNIHLNNLGKNGSAVEFDGVTGYFAAPSTSIEFTNKLVLSGAGLEILNGSSGRTYTFSGGVAGAGDFIYSMRSGADNQTYVFNANVKDWTGAFKSTNNRTSTLKFWGNATEMGAAIVRSAGTLNIEVGDGSTGFATTFDQAVGATKLDVKASAEATVKGALVATTANVNGKLTVAGVDSNIATLNLAGDFAVAEGGSVTLGTVAVSGAEATMANAGTAALTSVIELAETASLTMTGSYDISALGDVTVIGYEKDGQPSTNGYGIEDGDIQVVNVGEGSLTSTGATFYHGTATGTLVDTTGMVHVNGVNYSKYYVNGGDETLSEAKQHAELASIKVAEDAVLVVDEAMGTSLLAAESTGTVSINTGVVVTVDSAAPAVKLAGTGTYAMGSANIGQTELGDNWHGAVSLSGFAFSNTSLTDLWKGDSWVEMNGITGGYLSAWNGNTESANIRLTNPGEDGIAWNWSQGTSMTAQPTITFDGKWEGTGTFQLTDLRENVTFAGDISGWEGKFDYSGNHGSTLTFKGDATEINVAIENNGVNDATDANKQFHIAVENEAVFNKEVASHTLTIADDASATFHQAEMELASLTLGNDAATMTVWSDELAAAEGTVTITETLTAGEGSILHSNLDLKDGVVLAFNDTLTMTSTLGVEGMLTLDEDSALFLELASFEAGSGLWIDLIMAGDGSNLVYTNPGLHGVDASTVFTNSLFESGDYQVFATTESFGITRVPEPTTGTLSLLALMALAARRRKH